MCVSLYGYVDRCISEDTFLQGLLHTRVNRMIFRDVYTPLQSKDSIAKCKSNAYTPENYFEIAVHC